MKPNSAATLSISLLGGFSLEWAEHVLTDDINHSPKPWSVLAYLILHRDHCVHQSELIDVFWPEEGGGNPANALKTLLYRIRMMLEPLVGPDVQPILGRRGCYCWNHLLDCWVDVDEFELLCRQAEDKSLTAEARCALYEQALSLYRGDLLPKLAQQMWLLPLSVRFHALYLDAVKAFAALLEERALFGKMYDTCIRASQLDGLDEGLHALVVRALLRQGKGAAALEHYQKATDLLYRSLGVAPSKELRDLYKEIMATEKALETDLEVIMGDLRETARRDGAFVCEYGFFQEAYRLEVRRAARSGACVHLCLLTLSLPNGRTPQVKPLSAGMDSLREVLVSSLRRGDVVARFSRGQYVVMLPSASLEDSEMVMERVVQSFQQQYRHGFLRLSVRVREMELMV